MLKTAIEGIIFSFQLLSTIPLKKKVPYEKEQVRISVMSYPIVGAFLGILIFSLLFVITEWTTASPLVLTLLIVTLTIVYSGGLHLDGWMDASDAFFSYKSQSEKLEIMKDPRIGAFAAISVFLLLAWKLVLIYEIITLLSVKQFILVALIPFFTRMSLGMKLYFGQLARQEGMAFAMKKYIRKKDSLSYLMMLLLVFLVITIFVHQLLLYVVILFLSSICFYFLSATIDHQVFGGITGDTLGASVEGGELWLWMTLYLSLSFVTG